MFESLGRTTAVVIAAIAVSGMLLYAFPAQQLASAQFEETINQDQDLAQRIVDDTDQRIRQTQEQDQEQEIDQELEQENEAEIDQSEENNQANVIETGDNTATTTQIGDNDANNNALAADAEGGEGGESKNYKSKYSSSSGGSGGDAEASSAIEQEVDNEATTTQDSSADDNVQANVNTFGNDVALVDQDNVADQTAVNVGLQFQNQEATNEDVNVQYGTQAQDANICDPDLNAVFIGDIC